MQLLRKMIILSAVKDIGKGVIKLEALGAKVKGIITIFEPKGLKFRLGLRVGFSRLYEYDMAESVLEFSLDDGMDISERIDCIVIDSELFKPILMGSSDGKIIDINKIMDMFTKNIDEDLFKETSKIIEVASIPEEKIPEKKEEEIKAEKVIDINDEDFFNSIRPQLDELFKCYPADKELMRSVPDSKWVRVNYDKDEFYVVGILYNGKRATHICYGIPGLYTVRPKQKSEWLPLDYADPEGKGYWVIFQDAFTGKTLE